MQIGLPLFDKLICEKCVERTSSMDCQSTGSALLWAELKAPPLEAGSHLDQISASDLSYACTRQRIVSFCQNLELRTLIISRQSRLGV